MGKDFWHMIKVSLAVAALLVLWGSAMRAWAEPIVTHVQKPAFAYTKDYETKILTVQLGPQIVSDPVTNYRELALVVLGLSKEWVVVLPLNNGGGAMHSFAMISNALVHTKAHTKVILAPVAMSAAAFTSCVVDVIETRSVGPPAVMMFHLASVGGVSIKDIALDPTHPLRSMASSSLSSLMFFVRNQCSHLLTEKGLRRMWDGDDVYIQFPPGIRIINPIPRAERETIW